MKKRINKTTIFISILFILFECAICFTRGLTVQTSSSLAIDYLKSSYVDSKQHRSKVRAVYENVVCAGTEDIVAVGQINGKTVSQSASSYHLQFNENDKCYSISIDLKVGDFICFFMKSKGSYIYGFGNDEYSKKMINSAGFGKYTLYGRQHFLVNFEGKYEFVIGGNVENLSFPTDIWEEGGGSFIQYYGSNISYTYLLLDGLNAKKSRVFTPSKYEPIQQYGPYGSVLNNVVCLKVEDSFFLRVPYDKNYSDYAQVSIETENDDCNLNIELLAGAAYRLDSINEPDFVLGKACEYLFELVDSTNQAFNEYIDLAFYNDLESECCEDLFNKFKNLDENSRTIVNKSKIVTIEESKFVPEFYSDLHNDFYKNYKNRNQLALFFLYLFIVINISVIFTSILLIIKRQYYTCKIEQTEI